MEDPSQPREASVDDRWKRRPRDASPRKYPLRLRRRELIRVYPRFVVCRTRSADGCVSRTCPRPSPCCVHAQGSADAWHRRAYSFVALASGHWRWTNAAGRGRGACAAFLLPANPHPPEQPVTCKVRAERDGGRIPWPGRGLSRSISRNSRKRYGRRSNLCICI